MACDTVAGWQVVLANGEIVEANANENADLWQVCYNSISHFSTLLTLQRQ